MLKSKSTKNKIKNVYDNKIDRIKHRHIKQTKNYVTYKNHKTCIFITSLTITVSQLIFKNWSIIKVQKPVLY